MKKYQKPTFKYYVGIYTDIFSSSSEIEPQDLGGGDWGCEDVL